MGPQLAPHFVQYTSAISKSKKLTFRQRIGLVETSAIRELCAHIIENKLELETHFRSFDIDGDGEFILFIKKYYSVIIFLLLIYLSGGRS